MQKDDIRNSNIDILKIILTLMILFHHYSGNYIEIHFNFFSNIINDAKIVNVINNLISDLMFLCGKIGTNCFILISGFFLIDYKKSFLRKAIKLFLHCMIVSVCVYAFSIFTHYDDFSFIQLLLCIIAPVDKYWFLHVYLTLLLLAPFLNFFLNKLNRGMYMKFLILLFIIWCLIPTIGFVNSNFRVNNLGWFIFLYSFSGFIKLHTNIKFEKKKYIILFILILFTHLFACELQTLLEEHFTFSELLAPVLFKQNNVIIFFLSVILFCIFNAITIKGKSYMSLLSSASLTTYMAHSNTPTLIFIEKIVDGDAYLSSVFFLLYSLLVCFSIYLLSLLLHILITVFLRKKIDVLSSKIINFGTKITKNIIKIFNNFIALIKN